MLSTKHSWIVYDNIVLRMRPRRAQAWFHTESFADFGDQTVISTPSIQNTNVLSERHRETMRMLALLSLALAGADLVILGES